MPTPSHRSSGFIVLPIALGYSGDRCDGFFGGLGAGNARTEQRVARGAVHDYFQMQIERALDRRVARGVSGRLAKTDEVDGRQMGLL